MTVDFSIKHEDSTTCFTASQTSTVSEENQEEQFSEGVNDLNKNQHGFLQGTSTSNPNSDQPFYEKDGLTLVKKVATRSSSRPGKRPITNSPPESLNPTQESSTDSKRLKLGEKPVKRQWKSWGAIEKNVFFEALIEHSKDFDKIHSYLIKHRNLSSVVKNKNQVRHFYYRTLNKISKYLPVPHDPSESKKSAIDYEVRCLLCYNELRKKLRSLKEKDGKKLTELIETGKTTVRHHGRNFCIRAPLCRTLKKPTIDEIEPAPSKIILELLPKDNKTWCIIQELAQNPRLRTNIATRKSLFDLLTFLHYKWKLQSKMIITLSPGLVVSQRKVNKTNDADVCAKNKNATEDKMCINDMGNEQDSTENSSKTEKSKVSKKDVLGCKNLDQSPVNNPKNQQKLNMKTKKRENIQKEIKVKGKDGEKMPDEPNQSPESEKPDKNKQKCVENVPEKEEIKNRSEENSLCERSEETENNEKQNKDDIYKTRWNINNCTNITIADVYRKLGSPPKISLYYNLTLEDCNETDKISNYAIEQLVKIASGEFYERNEMKKAGKKNLLNETPPSKIRIAPKESVNMTKPLKVAKAPTVNITPPTKPKPVRISVKTTPKTKIAPKQVVEPSLVIPHIVPSVLNHVPIRNTSKSGNHLTYGFTPLSSVQNATFLPTSKKNMKSRIVVQRTLLPRPVNELENNISNKETMEALLVPSDNPSQGKPSSQPKHLSKPLNVAAARQCTPGFSVDSLLNLAMTQECPGNVDTILSHTSKSSYGTIVCTEELDRGVSGGNLIKSKEVKTLDEEVENLDNRKDEHGVDHSQDLLDNLKSSEDEDPFKLLSPPHIQQFQPEWLNEESSDFSLSNFFGNMEHSPNKHKPTNVLDTPKKGQTGFKLHEDEECDTSRFQRCGPAFCDFGDESSVDYVKKFRDLAKEMKSDCETVVSGSGLTPNTNHIVSFKSLLPKEAGK